jgi:hypothetical protein
MARGRAEVSHGDDMQLPHGIPPYAYSAEIPLAVLRAKYRWARGADLIPAV